MSAQQIALVTPSTPDKSGVCVARVIRNVISCNDWEAGISRTNKAVTQTNKNNESIRRSETIVEVFDPAEVFIFPPFNTRGKKKRACKQPYTRKPDFNPCHIPTMMKAEKMAMNVPIFFCRRRMNEIGVYT